MAHAFALMEPHLETSFRSVPLTRSSVPFPILEQPRTPPTVARSAKKLGSRTTPPPHSTPRRTAASARSAVRDVGEAR